MAEPITCPTCGEVLDVADGHRGRRVRCPICRHEFVAPGGADPVYAPARPARPRRPRDDDGDDRWDDAALIDHARRRVSGPASWLRVCGGLYLLCGLVGLAAAVWLGIQAADNPAAVRQDLNAQNDEDVYVLVATLGVCSALAVGCGGLMVFGAGKMQRLESHGWATAAAGLAIASVMFCTCALVFALPVGIWALVAVNDGDVREAFRLAARRRYGD